MISPVNYFDVRAGRQYISDISRFLVGVKGIEIKTSGAI